MTPRFGRLFWRQVVRPSLRRPVLTLLNVFSIGLGVAVFLAIQLANEGAFESFKSAAELTGGRSDLEIRGDLPEDLFPQVEATEGVRTATPLVEGVVVIPHSPGGYLRILGVDPFSGRDLFAFDLAGTDGSDLDLEKWLSDQESVALPATTWEDLQPLLPDGRLEVLAGTTTRHLRPAFVFSPKKDSLHADDSVAAMDIGWAQELLGRVGRLSSIQIILDSPAESEAVAARLREIAPADALVAPPASRSREMESMLGAFRLNLTAMSLVSIIVGMLLIYNSVSAAVVRRRTEIAILRANGATRFEIRCLFLGEAAFEGLLGCFLGLILAPVLLGFVSNPIEETISSLYDLVRIGPTGVDAWQLTQALGLGLSAALVAAWRPASEAAQSDPARILHEGSALDRVSPLRPVGLVLAAVLLATAFFTSWHALGGGPKWLGFASAAAVVGGFSLLVPWLTVAVSRPFRRAGVLSRLASDHLVRSLHRNAVTIASLAAAVALTLSVTVMISSFRASVERWIERTLVADLYVSPAVNDVAGFGTPVPEDAVEWLRQQPETIDLSAFREETIRLRDRLVTLTVIEGQARGDLDYLDGSLTDASALFTGGRAIAISESLANRFGLHSGEDLTLATPKGPQAFLIAGIYRDFSSDRGAIMMQSALYRRFWSDPAWQSIGIKLADPADTPAVAGRFREKFSPAGQFVIYDNTSLRERVFEIFDQTFAVTSVLRGIAITVAVIGVLFSLSALVLERQREIGALRALGSSRTQVLGIFLGESFLIGLTACLSGLASGVFLSMVLTWVINKAFFGWTIQLTYPILPILATPLWLLPAALLAALIPAWRAANIRPARAVRFE